MGADRYEKVRADWLLAHEASWHMSDRRMATQLKRKAAQKERSAAGAAESSHHEGQIKPLVSRFLARGEDAKETMYRQLFVGLVAVPTVVLWLGPALVVSMALYGLATTGLLKLKRVPSSWPWLVGAGLMAAGGWLLLRPSGFLSITPWPLAINFDGAGFLVSYGWMQATLGLLFTAWQVRRHGWPGVTIKGKPKTPGVPVAPSALIPTSTSTALKQSSNAEVDTPAIAPRLPVVPALPEMFEETKFDGDEALEFAGWMTDENEETEGEKSNV